MRSSPKSILLAGTAVYLPAVLLLIAVGIVSSFSQIPISEFLHDTNAIAEVPFYTGIVSQLGLFIWAATAIVCLLTALLLKRKESAPRLAGFLLMSGLLTALLALDDAFLLHEEVVPEYLGLHGSLLPGLQVVWVITLLVTFRTAILQTDYVLLILALAILVAALVFDGLDDLDFLPRLGIQSDGARYFLEDGTKLMGIAGWFGYFALTCVRALSTSSRKAEPDLTDSSQSRS